MTSASGLEVRTRLTHALAGTSESQRRLADLRLPALLQGFLAPSRVATLRPAGVLLAVLHSGDGHEDQVLFTQRSRRLRNHSGQVSLPGGGHDRGDGSLTATALREAEEEVGLDPARVEVLGYLDDYPTGSGYRITPVVGWVEGTFAPRAEPAEVAATFLVPLPVLLDSSRYRRKSFLRNGITLPFYQLDFEGHHIWGATAGILRDLCLRVAADGESICA
ncbi:MAG TPA: CoA pyrophosphatase [Nevskiaceae bacterium]|nr:CoA pyrophosphatase [Nevskiaceae bacterium]